MHLPRLQRILSCFAAGLLLVGVGTACSVSTPPKPTVPDSTLVSVLADLHLVRARAELYGPVPRTLRDSVLASHGLDSARFASILDYYANHPEPYLTVYAAVLDRLNESWYRRRPAGRPLPDSLIQQMR